MEITKQSIVNKDSINKTKLSIKLSIPLNAWRCAPLEILLYFRLDKLNFIKVINEN